MIIKQTVIWQGLPAVKTCTVKKDQEQHFELAHMICILAIYLENVCATHSLNCSQQSKKSKLIKQLFKNIESTKTKADVPIIKSLKSNKERFA